MTMRRVAARQVYDLWEAIHEVPDLVTRWRDDAEEELLKCFDEYDGKWAAPGLRAIYDRAIVEAEF